MSYKERPEDVLIGVMMDATRGDKHAIIYEALSHKIGSLETLEAQLAMRACFAFYERTKSSPTMLDIDEEAKKSAYQYDEVGGETAFYWAYLPHCYALSDHGSNAEWYIESILSRVARNDIANMHKKYGPNDELPHVISVIRGELDKIEEGMFMGDKTHVGTEYLADLDRIVGDMVEPGMQTGFTRLDELIGGVTKEDLFIIGARPSVGKTSFALSIAESIMNTAGPVAFYSFDMGKTQMLLRLLSFESLLTIKEIKTKEFHCGRTEGYARLAAAYDKIGSLPLFLTFQHMNIQTLCRSIRTDVKKRGVKAVFVDYMQLVTAGGRSEYDAVTETSKSLKGLTHELDVPIFALSQLRRPETGDRGKMPTLADLRSSGQIEQDASLVVLLHRKPEEGGNGELLSSQGVVTVVKAQNAAPGRVDMRITKGFRWVEE